MEKLKLIPQTNFNSKDKETVIIQNIDADYIEKTLSNLIRSIERLEDKINEIEHRLGNHINDNIVKFCRRKNV